MIATWEIRAVLSDGDIIEDYPEDMRGHSRLMLGYGENGRPITWSARQRPTIWL